MIALPKLAWRSTPLGVPFAQLVATDQLPPASKFQTLWEPKSGRLKTVPEPLMPPPHAVPYNVAPESVSPPCGEYPLLGLRKRCSPNHR